MSLGDNRDLSGGLPIPDWPPVRRLDPKTIVAGLLVLLAGVTIGGVLVGRAVKPAATTAAVATTTTTATRPRVRARKPVVARLRWGPLTVVRAGRFPAGGDRAAAVILGKRLVVAGGNERSAVLAGPVGGRLARIAALPSPRAAAGAFVLGGVLYLVGGESASKPTDEILRIDVKTRRVASAGRFVEPLTGAGVVTRGGAAYFIGGWTGEKFATAVLKFVPPSTVSLVGRLPDGVRSPAVAAVGRRIYVAGGSTAAGRSRAVDVVDLATGTVKRLGNLPRALDDGALVASGSRLYFLGGRSAAGKPVDSVIRIDPATGRSTVVGKLPRPFAGVTVVPDGTRALVVVPSAGAVYRVG